jgi:hypothetical protein
MLFLRSSVLGPLASAKRSSYGTAAILIAGTEVGAPATMTGSRADLASLRRPLPLTQRRWLNRRPLCGTMGSLTQAVALPGQRAAKRSRSFPPSQASRQIVFNVGDPNHATNVAVPEGDHLLKITHEGDDQLQKVDLARFEPCSGRAKMGSRWLDEAFSAIRGQRGWDSHSTPTSWVAQR